MKGGAFFEHNLIHKNKSVQRDLNGNLWTDLFYGCGLCWVASPSNTHFLTYGESVFHTAFNYPNLGTNILFVLHNC